MLSQSISKLIHEPVHIAFNPSKEKDGAKLISLLVTAFVEHVKFPASTNKTLPVTSIFRLPAAISI